MADSPASSDLSDPPSVHSDEGELTTPAPSIIDTTLPEADLLGPPAKRRKTAASTLAALDRQPSSQPEQEDDNISLSSDGWSSAPGSPNDDEYSLRDQAQTHCLWRDCDFGSAINNDDLVDHVQEAHCATTGPKKTKYVCEWGECQRKASNHPSGYALKAHMRSHTKQKPYYCALPECDKAFTRSDALAKHMRTVHEPDPAKGGLGPVNESTPSGKKGTKIRLTNGSTKAPPNSAEAAPTHDEDGHEIDPSPPNDNITYIPAHHPITGQPGFMIHYPPDIHFTAWESSIAADQLMRLLRRQVHWAESEGAQLKKEVDDLEQQKREEWTLKEILLEGMLDSELAQADREDLARTVDVRVREAMERDAQPGKQLLWTGGEPKWRTTIPRPSRTVNMDIDTDTPVLSRHAAHSPSPPPTGASAGFDGEADPYDNYMAHQMAQYEERERMRSMQNTPAKSAQEQQAAEADAVGALIGMSGVQS